MNVNFHNKEKYQCPICFNLMYEPIQLDCCGHNLCSICFGKLESVICPVCRQKGRGFSDIRLKREMFNEMIKCVCGTNIVFSQLTEHMNKCIMVACTVCKSPVLRNEFYDHAKICPEFFIECEKCIGIVKRKDMSMHSELYCTNSETCLKIPCQICKDNPQIPVTTFQRHYEQHHLGRSKTLVILSKVKPTFTID